ncbi:MAG: thioredoxin family protein [Dehalococcoidia bacterium]|nr:thioredoxin family protein [Dehalococcoidia bacterium]
MVQRTKSVVTPERFEQGLSYEQFLARLDRNRERFDENYRGTSIPAEEAAALRALVAKPDGPAKMLVLGESWCPDVFRGAPVFACIAAASGIDARFFFRDENKDIMAEFLKDGEFESIPVAVFYTKDHRYIAHWIERPQLANDEMKTKLRPMYARFGKPDMTDEEKQAVRAENIAFQHGPIWANWRQETIREVVRLLDGQTA